MKPRLLDLFCSAGGAAMGYARAGFEVVGIDIEDQPRYPFEFYRGDVMSILRMWDERYWSGFDAIHASPPCQAYSVMRALPNVTREHPDLIAPVRSALQATGLPYVIENVPGAPMRDCLTLCGSMFDLGAWCRDGVYRQLRCHRWFECDSPLTMPCAHRGQPIGVYGHGGGGQMTRGYKGTKEEYREAMGMPWATKAEIAQAIPPAYTEWIGHRLMTALTVAA